MFRDAGHELALVGGPVRDAFLGRVSADLDFATSATPDETEALLAGWGDAHWDIGRAFGTIGALRRRGGREVVVEVTTYRTDAYDPTSRKPEVVFGDSLEGDLSRRDFTVNAMAVRLPDLTFVDPFDGLADLAARYAAHAGHRAPVLRRRPAADAARRPVRRASSGSPSTRRRPAAITQMSERIAIVSAERVRDELVKLLLSPDAAARDPGARRLRPRRRTCCPSCRRCGSRSTSTTGTRTSTSTPSPCSTRRSPWRPGPTARCRGRTSCCAWPRSCTTSASRPPAASRPPGGVSFHHHEVVGAKLAARRLKALRFDKETVQAVARLTELHLRFHGYGDGSWTDSAVRRYVTDAGPLLERLHRLTRSDCTTRNRRKAQRLSSAYDDLEARIAALREQEELASIRPDLDGQQIMAILGIAPGPVVGRAYKHLLEVRLDQGPLDDASATRELLTWWAVQPESAGAAGDGGVDDGASDAVDDDASDGSGDAVAGGSDSGPR